MPDPIPAVATDATHAGRARALEAMHERLCRAQEHYQSTQAEGHRAFLQASELLAREWAALEADGHAGGPTATAPETVLPAPAPEPRLAAPAVPAPERPRPGPAFQAPAPEPAGPAGQAPPAVPAAPAADLRDGLRTTILGVVAEATGYPMEMLDLDLDLEAGLGIDSLKLVQIFATLQEQVPAVAEADLSVLASLRTLRQILAYAQDQAEKKNRPLP